MLRPIEPSVCFVFVFVIDHRPDSSCSTSTSNSIVLARPLAIPKLSRNLCSLLNPCTAKMRPRPTKSLLQNLARVSLSQHVRPFSDGAKTCALIVGNSSSSRSCLSRHQLLFFSGAPGSGKGTISNWIVRDFGLQHISSGDLLRQHINDGTALGKEAKGFIDRGALVPDETMVNLISSELKKLGKESWLLDGFPRTATQAKALQGETPINVVINLDVPFETIIDRVKGVHLFFFLH